MLYIYIKCQLYKIPNVRVCILNNNDFKFTVTFLAFQLDNHNVQVMSLKSYSTININYDNVNVILNFAIIYQFLGNFVI